MPQTQRERCTFERFDLQANPGMTEARNAAGDWAAGDGLPWLVLFGEVRGTGKTHLATAALGERIARREAGVFAVVPELLDQLRATFRRSSQDELATVTIDELRARVQLAPCLVLDDLGAEKASDWADEQLYLVLNYRYARRLPTLITTNEPESRFPQRIVSRLEDFQVSRIVACEGRDYRRAG